MKKNKEPLTIHIVPSKKLSPSMEKLEVYNQMIAEKVFKGAKAWIDFWRMKKAEQDLIKEELESKENAKNGRKKKNVP